MGILLTEEDEAAVDRVRVEAFRRGTVGEARLRRAKFSGKNETHRVRQPAAEEEGRRRRLVEGTYWVEERMSCKERVWAAFLSGEAT